MSVRSKILIPENRTLFLEAIRSSNSISAACGKFGASISTWEHAKKQAAKGVIEFIELLEDFNVARADAEAYHVRQLYNSTDPKYHSWVLQHLNPDAWSDVKRIEIKVEEQLTEALLKIKNVVPPAMFEKIVIALSSDGMIDEFSDTEGSTEFIKDSTDDLH